MFAGSSKKTPTEATIKIPFESPARAELVFRVLNVDKEPRRNFVHKELRLEGDYLLAHFSADEVKKLRTAIASFFEGLLLCKDTIKEFNQPPPSEAVSPTTNNCNAGAHTSPNTT